MLTLLTPIFLWAALAALIPLVLHMIQSRRTVRVPFSTIRFLKLADAHSSRRIKMEHFILWLIRTLLVLAIVGAFTMPMLRTEGFGRLLGRSSRDVAIVLDTSYSMRYQAGTETVWDSAIDTAANLIEGLGEQDRVCVYLAGEDAVPLIEQLSGDLNGAVDRLGALMPGYTASALGPAIMAANAALKEDTRKREREIHIITDNQAIAWDSFNEWDPAALAENTAVFVSGLGVDEPENASPIKVTIDPPLIMADMPVHIDVTLGSSDPARDTTVTLFIDDTEVGRRAVESGPAGARDVQFTLPPQGPGVHVGRIETPPDPLSIDDPFHFLLQTRDHLPTLCVGDANATMFLRLALESGPANGSGIALETMLPEALADTTLATYACVFLCDALPLPGQDVLRLEQYVQAGGLLVILPGNSTRVGDYSAWRCLPGMPVAIDDIPTSERTHLLHWQKPQHPILSALRRGLGTPRIAIRRQLRWDGLADDAEILISAAGESPFLVSRVYGQGCVLMMAVSANRTWSDLPLSPYFLPMIHQTVQFSAGLGRANAFIWATDQLNLSDHLPDATPDAVLNDPDGARIPIRSTAAGGKTRLHAEAITRPGVYTLSAQSAGPETPALAVNMRRDESDLTPATPDAIAARLRLDELTQVYSPEELKRRVDEHRVGKTFGETLLWIALILAIIEVLYGNSLVKDAPRLSDALRIGPGGKVARS